MPKGSRDSTRRRSPGSCSAIAYMPRRSSAKSSPLRAIEMQRQLAVRCGGEDDAVHRRAQLEVVVDLAVGDQRRAAGLEERLVAGDEIDDGEAPLHHRDVARRDSCRRRRARDGPAPPPSPAARWATAAGRRWSSCRRCRTSARDLLEEVRGTAPPRLPRCTPPRARRGRRRRARRAGSALSARRIMASASAGASSSGTRSPVSPSRISARGPTLAVATTGTPAAQASITTLPSGS